MSGYCACTCRDCIDVSMTDQVGAPTLCQDCSEAGCTPNDSVFDYIKAYGLGYECQRADAYASE